MAAVLIVEDDLTVAEVVVSYLRSAGHECTHLADGRSAAETLETKDGGGFDLILLDLMLPGVNGIELCRQARSRHPALPIIMLTALDQTEDRIAGLEVGADDYIAKPFSPRELVLRVQALLRRTVPPARQLKLGPITVDTAARRASKNGVELNLAVREFDLLTHLMANPGRAFTRAELMAAVWGWTFGDQSTVTVHVRRLREKLEDDPRSPELIQTVWGVGYRLGDPAEQHAPSEPTGRRA